MDLETRLYLSFGSSMYSEREAYDRAIDLLLSTSVKMDFIRLDSYYSSPSYMDNLGESRGFVIPEKNSSFNGPQEVEGHNQGYCAEYDVIPGIPPIKK